uniref:hypothetical protein n=1 Tax=Actinoplanes derwentensis TaxID=113562 RepID=UPI0012FD6ABD|nr:hypothetical protein [Actinoplanes derwentensis]
MDGVLRLSTGERQAQFLDLDRDVVNRLLFGQRPVLEGQRPVGMVDDDGPGPGPQIVQSGPGQIVGKPGPKARVGQSQSDHPLARGTVRGAQHADRSGVAPDPCRQGGRLGEDFEVGDQSEFEERRAGGLPVMVVAGHGQQVSCPLGRSGRAGRMIVDRGEHLQEVVPKLVRQAHHQLSGQFGIDLAENDVLEGGDVEGVFGADVDTRRKEHQ